MSPLICLFMTVRIITTLCLLCQDRKILLGMKKRGFGKDRWNGFGGKVLPGEDLVQTAKREMSEECGVQAVKLERLGHLIFEYPAQNEIVETHIFQVLDFSGEPRESEEMKPRWFKFAEIPYTQMWPDDRFWLPLFLAGKNFCGRFAFNKDFEIAEHELLET